MGLFEKIFGNRPKVPERDYEGFFKMLNGYTPHFTSWSGGIYESEMVRSAISTLATHISKLNVETVGSAKPALQKKLRNGPNEFQTWSQFMQRAATIFYIHNTCIITPSWDDFGQISGIYTPVPSRCELVQYAGKPYIRYEFGWGEKAAVELENVGLMVRMQYRNDFFGESNRALLPTMELIHIQNQGIEEGVKSAATYRFMATLNNWSTDEDLAKERKRFSASNFARDAEGGGILLFPNSYANVKQLEVKPWVVDADQMAAIAASVCEYFGVNEAVMTNKAIGDEWAAFYEGAVEPFAIQFSEVLTKMLFTFREQTAGNKVIATANRLQYMSARDKLDYSAQMADRGLVTRNEIREMWNLAPLPEPYGSQLPVRGEYYNVNGDEENDPENSQ